MSHTRTHVVQDSDLKVDQLENGNLEVATVIEGVLDSRGGLTYHRYVVHPGMYYGDKDPRVQVIAQRVHTPKVISEWEADAALRREER